jgi:hypothetical protein
MPFGERTEEAYYACVRQLSEHYNKSPDTVEVEELRQYFIHLKCVRKVARQTSTQALCAIKLFWEKTLRRPWPAQVEMVRANYQFKLPVVLSVPETRRILGAVEALDHRVCLSLIYSCGLRLGDRVKGFASRGGFAYGMLFQIMAQLLFEKASPAAAFQESFPAKSILLIQVCLVIDQHPWPSIRGGKREPLLMLGHAPTQVC